MTVSNSTDFSSNASTIIIAARRLLGVQAEEEPLTANDLAVGLDMLTRMLKTWEADPDLGTWLYTEGSLTLVASTASYVFGAGGAFTTIPFEIVDARINRTQDIVMIPLSRKDYYALPNKTTTGYPTQYFYDRQRDNGTLYVWPVPDVNAGTFKFTYRRRIMDTDAGADNLDIPPEWEEAVTNGLAKRLIPVYGRGGTPEAQEVITDAAIFLAELRAFDITNDNGSVSILPDYERSGWGRY